PLERHPLAVTGAGEQTIHDVLVSPRRPIFEEGVHFGRRRRQAGQIERDAADERLAVCFVRRRQAFFLKTRQDEIVNHVARPPPVFDGGRRRGVARGGG